MTAQLSRERLEEKLLEHIKHGGDSEEETMIRMLLAGMCSEPVGVFNIGSETCPDHLVAWTAKGQNLPNGVYWLHTAPPAPAIPDHLELIDKGRLMMLERSHQTLLDYRADSVWYWQGDEDDQPESLSCPVIMSAETLRELLAKSAPPAPVAVPDEKESISGSVFGEYYCDGWNTCRAAMLKSGPVTGGVRCNGTR